MDGREGIPSFYLNRGFRGSDPNPGSGNHGTGGFRGSDLNPGSGSHGSGGFQVPPPGFKIQSNPNLSHHEHTNMRLAPSMGSSFHLEHNPSPPPPSNFPHGFNMDGGGSGGDGGGGGRGGGVSDDGGGGTISIPTPGSRNDSVVKKKRGRPRKYVPEESHMALALTTTPSVALPDPNTPTPQKKRGRPRGSGRKQQLANCGMLSYNIKLLLAFLNWFYVNCFTSIHWNMHAC